MNNKQVAHLWANQSRNEASGSHFFFKGDTIYSYGAHFPIARHWNGCVLFTTHDYSVTTSKHKGYVRQSCHHLKVFHVPNLMEKPGRDAINAYADRIKAAEIAASLARDPEFKLQLLTELVSEANEFCALLGKQTRFELPSAEKLESLKERSRIAQAKKAKSTREKNERIAKENEVAINEWILGKRDSLPYSIGKVFLRRKGDDMQTSKGAIVSLAEAQKAFRFVTLKRNVGWHRNGETFPIGEFHLDAVNEQGVVAGCHRVTWDEIERFAKAQNWV